MLVALVAGVFIALAALGITGALRDDDRGLDPSRRRGEQWNLAMVGAPDVWERTTGTGVTVAVVDSGVDSRHPDLRGRLVASVSCVGATGDPGRCTEGGATDADGHGTHVAGIALATADDARGVAGVAPGADLISVRALEPDRCARRPCGAGGRAADVAAGLRWAVAAGADVVNLSLGATAGDGTDDLERAVDEAWADGVAVVVAGPGRTGGPTLPADSPAVVVTAVDAERRLAPYAGGVFEATSALAAPGGEARAATDDGCDGDRAVESDVPVPGGESDARGCLVGTSMAAPHVAGAIALLMATGATATEAVDAVLASARDLGERGPDALYGRGLLDIPAALDALP